MQDELSTLHTVVHPTREAEASDAAFDKGGHIRSHDQRFLIDGAVEHNLNVGQHDLLGFTSF